MASETCTAFNTNILNGSYNYSDTAINRLKEIKLDLYNTVAEIYNNINGNTLPLTNLDQWTYSKFESPMDSVMLNYLLATIALANEMVSKAVSSIKFAPFYSISRIWLIANDNQTVELILTDKDGFKIDIIFRVVFDYDEFGKPENSIQPLQTLIASKGCIKSLTIACGGNNDCSITNCSFDKETYKHIAQTIKKI